MGIIKLLFLIFALFSSFASYQFSSSKWRLSKSNFPERDVNNHRTSHTCPYTLIKLVRSVQEPDKGQPLQSTASKRDILTCCLRASRIEMAVNQAAVGGSIDEVEAATLNLKPEKPQRSKKRGKVKRMMTVGTRLKKGVEFQIKNSSCSRDTLNLDLVQTTGYSWSSSL